uniref:acyl-coenzyme A thioesterase THEM4-like n=1 Tax=Euleptes europaea TaxID=460621 RepID=UPI00253F6C24|nr:acyl-coenzyme A thioesterase THEM4-like [Euleptes europaea]
MLRSCVRGVQRLGCWGPPRNAPWVAASKQVLQHSTHKSLCSAMVRPLPSRKPKDYALPNSSWSKEMMDQFDKFMEMCKDGTWRRMPSHRRAEESVSESIKQHLDPKKKGRDTRFFLRNLDSEGLGFEYVMFLNPSQKRMVCLAQLGPYLEGPPGFVHGGPIATILDTTWSQCALFTTSAFLTANLSINYKSPVQLGSVILVDGKVDRTEGRKVFLSGQVQSVDGKTLYAEGTTSLFRNCSSVLSKAPKSTQQIRTFALARSSRVKPFNPHLLLSLVPESATIEVSLPFVHLQKSPFPLHPLEFVPSGPPLLHRIAAADLALKKQRQHIAAAAF